MYIDQNTIAEAIAIAPGWALVALTVPQDRLREAAQLEIAERVMTAIVGRVREDAEQIPLPL